MTIDTTTKQKKKILPPVLTLICKSMPGEKNPFVSNEPNLTDSLEPVSFRRLIGCGFSQL